MEKELKDIGGSKQEMIITLTKEELAPHYDEAYKSARQHISMQGFRKGKVPLNLIKKIYGKSIEIEAQQDIINKVFTENAQKDAISIIGQPELMDVEDVDEGIRFTVRYETISKFELKDFKGLTIQEPVHTVTDEEIEEAIKKIAIERADIEIAQEVEDENYVVGIKMEEIDPETKEPLAGKKAEEQHVFLGDPNLMPELKNDLIGKKGGDNFILSPLVNNPEMDQKEFLITVQEIQKLIPAEINDEFVKEYTKGKFDSPDDLREEIGFQLQEQWDDRSRKAMEDQIIEKLIDMHDDIPMPESIVTSTMESMLDDMKNRYGNNPQISSLTMESLGESLRPNAERIVKWELIRNQIIENEGIQIEEHDIEPVVEQEATRMNKDADSVRAMLMKNTNFLTSLLHKKTMDLVLDFAITEETEFPEPRSHSHSSHELDDDDDDIETFDNLDLDDDSDDMAEDMPNEEADEIDDQDK